MHPTVGRMVHYFLPGEEGTEFAAVVTAAPRVPLAEDVVSLAVLTPRGTLYVHNVPRSDKPFAPNTWCWPYREDR